MDELSVDLSDSRILVVDDLPANLDLMCQALELAGYQVMVATSGPQGLELASQFIPDLILLDVTMPEMDGFEVCRRLKQPEATRSIPVVFLTARDETADLLEGFRVGGVDYITKPFQKEEVLVRVQTQLERVRLWRDLEVRNAELIAQNRRLQEEIERRERLTDERDALADRLSQLEEHRGVAGFIGRSQAVQAVVGEIELLRQAHTVPVLVCGESGTGKEGVARAIHFGGKRTQGPFVAVNCAAIPDHLAESSFFGHMRGAFTGAYEAHRGYFEQADRGTLFLDEIGDLSLDLQAKLLRTLETNAVTPLGSTRERRVDVRVVAATNRDLAAMIVANRFREDLYFRLTGFTVILPPLRQRREDIPLLIDHFLRRLSEEMGCAPPGMSQGALAVLEAHDFPGNVRELKNLVEYALIRSQGAQIQAEHLRFVEFRGGGTADAPRRVSANTIDLNGPEPEERIKAFLSQHGSISNTECQALLSVTHQRASYLLKKLHAEGVLERLGQRRWARYRLSS